MHTKNHQFLESTNISKENTLYFKNFLIVGLTRNCSSTIKNDFARLNVIFENFAIVTWLIIESDSGDNTVEVLEEIKSGAKNFNYISLGNLSNTFPVRTERIAYCRNRYLDELKHNNRYKDFEYLIVTDLDGINDSLTEDALASCWLKTDWDVCTANQRGPYYDIYALRHPIWCPNNCMLLYDFLVNHNIDSEKSRYVAIRSRMINISEREEWIEVESAFGGLAIYRKDAIGKAYYIGVDSSGAEICEHVPFHKMLRENGKRIFINPKLINASYTEHTLPLKIINRVKEKIVSSIKKLVHINRKSI